MKGRALRLPFFGNEHRAEARSAETAGIGAGVRGLAVALVAGCLSAKPDDVILAHLRPDRFCELRRDEVANGVELFPNSEQIHSLAQGAPQQALTVAPGSLHFSVKVCARIRL